MKDDDLRDLVAKRRDATFKFGNGELAQNREEAMKFYRGDQMPCYGDSGDGLSTVVSRDTMEAVESMLPALIKPFVAGDEAVRFEPQGPEDEDGAKQATEYVNYLLWNHNDFFRLVHDSIKDGLLYRYGCAKVVYEEIDDLTFERYQGIDQQQVAALDAAEDIQIVGDVVEQNPDGTFNVRTQRTAKKKMYRVYVIPPERFLYESRIANLDEGTFFAHHDIKAVGDLIAMGLDKEKCKTLQPGVPDTMEDDERFKWEDQELLEQDDLARKVWVDECYIRCDYEGDGVLRWRKIILGGSANIVLLNEEADDHPFEGWTPIPEPHKLVGRSIHDLTRDIQIQKTAIKREGLNALYLGNRPQREVVEGQVNIDDLLSPAVNGIVRVKQTGMIQAIPSATAQVLAQSFQMVEALDADREARTGVTRYNQGMDANSLNKTATGVSIISNASMQRQELVARQYAESFLKGVCRKLLKLVSRYQDKAAVIRLRGEWVEVDPSDWNTGYDMSVSVGLGTGNKDQVMAHLTNLLQVQQQIAEGQGGPNGPLVTWENIYEVAKQLPATMGLKGDDRFFTDPAPKQSADGQPEQTAQPQEDPNAAAAAQAKAAQQADMAKHAAELKQKHDTAIEVARINAEGREEVARINAEKDILIAGITLPADLAPEPSEEADEPQPMQEMPDEAQEPLPEDMEMQGQPEPQIDPAMLEALMQEQQQPEQPQDPVPEIEL